MAKKKKLTKAQLEELARQEEEERQRQEEERLRLEEEERQRQEELERQRLERLEDQKEQEKERIKEEYAEISSYLERLREKRRHAAQERIQAEDWEHCKQCSHLPLVSSRAQRNDYRKYISDAPGETVEELLSQVSDLEEVTRQVQHERDMRRQEGDQDTVAELSEYLKDLREIARQRMEGAAAVTLLRHDELTPTEEDPNVVLEARDLPGVRFAMWINLEKNQRPPRTISWPSLGLSLEVHRRIGSQILAIRVAQLRSGGPAGGARSRFLPLGGSLDVQLLAVPAPTKPPLIVLGGSLRTHCPVHLSRSQKVETRGGVWALRQQGPGLLTTQAVNYPTIQDPTDPSKSVYPALGVSCKLAAGLHVGEEPIVGVWDPEAGDWATAGVEGVAYDAATGQLDFTAHSLGCMALLQDRAALLPYRAWNLRPTDGRGGRTAALTLYLDRLEKPFQFGIGEGRVWLLEAPVQDLSDLVGQDKQPRGLLQALSARGYHLLPEQGDTEFIELPEGQKIVAKEEGLDWKMCQELGMLCGAFLVGSSRWNRNAGEEHIIARVSEIVDWEGLGRTELHQTERIFSKEKMDKPTRPLAIMHRGAAGVCFVDARELAEELKMPPVYGSEEYYDSVYGEVHHNVLSLLRGTKTPRLVESEDAEVVAQRELLRASEEAVELATSTSALLTQTAAQLMFALRLLSFC